MKKRENGITLILLIVTIIVLVILAGIVINVIIDQEEIIEQSKRAVFVTNYREVEEKVKLYKLDKEIEEFDKEKSMQLPVLTKLGEEEKREIKYDLPSLEKEIKRDTKDEIENVDLYWVDLRKNR